jgi:flagellar capping protein FliD
VTKNADGKYTRGPLSSDMSISSLRQDLFRLTGGTINNNGIYKNLSEIGITINDSMSAVLSDSSKLEKALATNPNEVKYMLDSLMTGLQAKLNNYVGTKSYVDQSIKSADDQTKSLNSRMALMKAQLEVRQQNLINVYAEAQAQIQSMAYERQTLTSIISSVSYSA